MHPRLFAAAKPDFPAVVETTGSVLTFGDLERVANQGAHLFRALGIGTGDFVALMCDNQIAFFEIYWAAQRSGVTLVLISTRLTPTEVAYIVNDSGASLLLVSAALEGMAEKLEFARGDMPSLAGLCTIGQVAGLAEWGTLRAAQPDTPIAHEAAGGMMLYSSGTTGQPKGLAATPVGGSPITPSRSAELLGRLYGIDEDTIYLCPAPLYHAAPCGWSNAVISLGGTVVLMPRFEPEGFLAAIERWSINLTMVVPTMFVRLLKLPQATRARYDLSSLRMVVHAAAPCPAPVKRAMIDWLGPIVVEFYAGSEGNGHTTITSAEALAKPGSVGRATVGVLHICDDDGHELPCGEIGAVYFEGGRDFVYHNDPEKSAKARNPLHPTWTTIGDMGHVDEDGYLFLSDRKDFMIISGGVNIYPQEAENLLITHPAVADVAVFGVPHPEFGEEVKAVVQPVDWSYAGPELEAELISWCRSHLADVKCPRSIDFDPALPRAENGKLYKMEIKRRYALE
jgi:long-chain acyl-CoA synthetase